MVVCVPQLQPSLPRPCRRPAGPIRRAWESVSQGHPCIPETPDLSGNDRKYEISGLSPRQIAVLPIVALSPSIAEAARQSGVSERTLRRWVDEPAFSQQLYQLHSQSYDLARNQLMGLVPHFISVFAREAIENPNSVIRIRAADLGMYYALKLSEIEKISQQLDDVLAVLGERE